MAKLDRTLHSELSIEQQNAIELLLTGKSDRETAEACGVTRQTVSEWRNNNPRFVAELNRRRALLWENDIDRLRGLVREAITILESDLHGDDVKARRVAAIHLLRAVGIYGGDWEPKGKTSVNSLSLEMALNNM